MLFRSALPAFTVSLGGMSVLAHAAHGTTLTRPFNWAGSYSTYGPLWVYTGGGAEANNSNTRVGLSGSITTGGATLAFSGSWPLCP